MELARRRVWVLKSLSPRALAHEGASRCTFASNQPGANNMRDTKKQPTTYRVVRTKLFGRIGKNVAVPDTSLKPVYTVWVGGTEVNDYYMTKEYAESTAKTFIADGYDDVIIEEIA